MQTCQSPLSLTPAQIVANQPVVCHIPAVLREHLMDGVVAEGHGLVGSGDACDHAGAVVCVAIASSIALAIRCVNLAGWTIDTSRCCTQRHFECRPHNTHTLPDRPTTRRGCARRLASPNSFPGDRRRFGRVEPAAVGAVRGWVLRARWTGLREASHIYRCGRVLRARLRCQTSVRSVAP